MNDDDKARKRRSGKFAEFVVKYNWIFWALLVGLAIYMGRGNFANLIHTFRDWDEIQEEKGDVVLVQRLFNADRFYQEDPESYQDVVDLGNATYYHNLRVGSDLTLEQEKVEFENGDVYRHITLPYVETMDLLDAETLKMFTRFKYGKASAYYYDWEKDAWDEIRTFRGGTTLPKDTVYYINFGDEYYVLFDQLYAYHLEDDGVVRTDADLTFESHVSIQNGWEIIQPFVLRKDMEYQQWMLGSSTPLIDLESGEIAAENLTEKELILKGLGLGYSARWMADGIYDPVPEGYTPYGEDYYYRNVGAGQLDALLSAEDSAAASDLAFVQAYQLARSINEYGYFEIPIQNTALYDGNGIRYGYADLRMNAQIGSSLVTAAERFGKDSFEPAIRALADFFADRMAESASGAALPEYWHYKGELTTKTASSDTRVAAADFLEAAGDLLNDSVYKALGERLR